MSVSAPTIRFGTRGSALARTQTDLVADRLRAIHPEVAHRAVIIRTEGDQDQTTPLTVLGGRGVFTSALQDALRRRSIDAAVHSAKDLPTERPAGLTIAALLAREDPRDVFVSRHGCPLAELGPSPVIGTSSRRRAVQLRRLRLDARVVDLRGNIDTRLRKALDGDLDGIVLAAAGVARMGWTDRITEYLPLEIAVPSPGQGALAVEIRAEERGPARFLTELDEFTVSIAVRVERAFLRGIGGGCTSPVGAYASVEGEAIRLLGMIASEDGERVEWVDHRLGLDVAEEAARTLAGDLLQRVQQRAHATAQVADHHALALSGKRVLITRGDDDDPLAMLVAERGGEPVVVPTIRIVGPSEPEALVEAVGRLDQGEFDWVVFTSGNAVDHVLTWLDRDSAPISDHTKVAAVGSATATRLEAKGIDVALVPDPFTGEALVTAMIAAGVQGSAALFPHGDLASDTVPSGLAQAGARVETVEAYRTEPVTGLESDVLADLLTRPVDVAIFLSPSSVRNLVSLLAESLEVLDDAIIACIGPVTARAARDLELTVHIEPDQSTIPEMVAAIERYLAGRTPEAALARQPSSERSLL
ncbi:MAG: hydroxymethylbilane synthase [Thermomicrobiales bacterium]